MEASILFQNIKIGEVRHSLKQYNSNIYFSHTGSRIFCFQFQGIFLFDMNIPEKRNHPHNRNSCQLLKQFPSFRKKRNISPELINDNSFKAFPFFFRQKQDRTIHGGKYSSPVNIGHQISGSPDFPGHPHISKITVFEIQLRNASGSFQYNRIVFRFQPPESG